MDADKAELLCEAVPGWVDPDGPDERAALFATSWTRTGGDAGQVALLEVATRGGNHAGAACARGPVRPGP